VKKLAVFVIVLLVTMGAVYAFFTWRDWRQETVQRHVPDILIQSMQENQTQEEKFEAKIFFTSPDGRYLKPEKRVILSHKNSQSLAVALVEELLKGPVKAGYSTIPAGTKLTEAYLDGQGNAYLDFSSELKEKHVSGAWAEALTIYSIVNTVAANMKGVEKVYILVDGSMMDTLGGHLALNEPFSFRPEIVKNGDR